VVERIDLLNSLADAAWAELPRNAAKLRDYASQLADAYDAINLRLRVYERLVRQSDKPLLADAEAARDLPCDASSRISIERFLRMEVEDYLALESEIASNLRRIDVERDAVVQAHRDLTDAYVRSLGRTDEISLAAGRYGVRLATTRFDEREGFRFMDYAYAWIDRELNRVGQAEDS
jgi:DNA-directed RNA polymerase sigma subunit (sigma70/sigma32)